MHPNLIDDLIERETKSSFNLNFIDKYRFSRSSITKLDLKISLKEHEGCVNCLEWNSTGQHLASGSDDLNICIWDPFKEKLLHKIVTKHRGNIFSIRFLPFTNDSLIASCAADRDIYIYDLNRKQNLYEIHAHQGRAKSLVTSQNIPSVFFSAGEDGFVLQHDIRAPSNEVTQLLLNFAPISSQTETKCLSINELNPFLIAVGCNDPYARVYDRRMIKLKSFTSRINEQPSLSSNETSKYVFEFNLKDDENDVPLTYYVPGHLPKKILEYRKRMKTLSVTFLTFSPDGKELLVNLGGEQLYLYDLNGQNPMSSIKYDLYKQILTDENEEMNINEQKNDPEAKKKYKLSPKADLIKAKANECFEQNNYLEAIEYYNQAIKIAPDSAILYGNRAASLMKRNWDGDTYMAMKDCYQALKLDQYHLKSHFRLARCLSDLKWFEEADECLKIFRRRYPDFANSQACDNLIKEINTGLENLKKAKRLSAQLKKNDSESSESENESKKYKFDKNNNEETKNFSNKVRLKHLNQKYQNVKLNPIDFKSRFCGHCNFATDIKEACFLGKDFISAGSDDGSFFIWDKKTTNVVRVLKGDESIVNCLAPHPFTSILASSGIDSDVKIWCPKFSDNDLTVNKREVLDVKSAAANNQLQMNSHPLEFLLLNAQNMDSDSGESVSCRPS